MKKLILIGIVLMSCATAKNVRNIRVTAIPDEKTFEAPMMVCIPNPQDKEGLACITFDQFVRINNEARARGPMEL